MSLPRKIEWRIGQVLQCASGVQAGVWSRTRRGTRNNRHWQLRQPVQRNKNSKNVVDTLQNKKSLFCISSSNENYDHFKKAGSSPKSIFQYPIRIMSPTSEGRYFCIATNVDKTIFSAITIYNMALVCHEMGRQDNAEAIFTAQWDGD
jgi:hypothetical protein